VTLAYCYKVAEENYPLAHQKELLTKASELRATNYGKNWLPQMNLNGNVSLQSDVTAFAIPRIAGLPPMESPTISKDWYKMTLDLSQSIYEGNVTAYQKKLESMNLKADQKSLQIELYKLKERINQVFMSIFLLKENEKLLITNHERLDVKLRETNSAVKNGVMMASNEDAIKVELVRIDQQLEENKTDRTTAYRILSELVSSEIPETTKLVFPKTKVEVYTFENHRHEAELYNIQGSRVEVMKNMVTTKWNPKVFAYGQLGYGRPGLNMLSNSFDPWWLIGAKVSWNFFNWNLNKNEKKIYDVQGDILKSQKETFDKNLKITSENDMAQITKLTAMLSRDQEIIGLRERITKAASSQLDNGVITASDYVNRLNEETQSRLSLQLHLVQLELAKLTYLYNQGKL
ncbi:MAG: TolC family protein, partial [Bacteroidota bacterium]